MKNEIEDLNDKNEDIFNLPNINFFQPKVIWLIKNGTATILSLIFILSFKKDLLSCLIAIFKRIFFKKEIASIVLLSLSIFFEGNDN